MAHVSNLKPDQRELEEKHLGKPLASSLNTALWRCFVCPSEAHSLLLVAADQHRCVGHYASDCGTNAWLNEEVPVTESIAVGEAA